MAAVAAAVSRAFPTGLIDANSCLRSLRSSEVRHAAATGEAMGSAAVLYHYPCPDGVFAALAAHLYHKAVGCAAAFYPNTVYSPCRVKDIDLEGVDTVYLLDFAGPEGFALELAQEAEEVIILDHHKTALDRLPGKGEGPQNLQCVLDMCRSGATISYDYFSEKILRSSALLGSGAGSVGSGGSLNTGLVADGERGRVETLFRYIEDADLWRWCLPESKAFSSGLRDLAIEFSASVNPAVFDQLLALDPAKVISSGKESLARKQLLIDQALVTAFELNLGRGKFGRCLGVRADSIAHLRSELGNQLAEKSLALGLLPVGAVVYTEPALHDKRLLKISLRGVSDDVDTTTISEAYGGGGHRKASSFLVTKVELEEWRQR